LIQPLAWTTVEFFVVRAASRASKASRPAIRFKEPFFQRLRI
jgi:hypothetical protein